MRRIPLPGAAAALCLLVGAAGCGGADEDSEEEVLEQISDQLQDDGEGLEAETADCFAQIVIDEVGLDDVRDADLTADDPPANLRDEYAAAGQRAADECPGLGG